MATRSEHALELESGQRFAFGSNWARFLTKLNDTRIHQAEDSLRSMLGVPSLHGKRFLDVGSGSGLFSLAARRLGAVVYSFDYDPESAACTQELRRRYFPDDPLWQVESGSVLDPDYLSKIGSFDVLYSWGVLHHTGNMNQAFSNIDACINPGGQLFIAIYNDQGLVSRYWTFVKRAYNHNIIARYTAITVHAPYLIGLRWLVRAATGRLHIERGMSLWFDMLDWLGGYPFEVAKPERVFHIFRDKGYVLQELRTCGARMGCNEFVFRKGL